MAKEGFKFFDIPKELGRANARGLTSQGFLFESPDEKFTKFFWKWAEDFRLQKMIDTIAYKLPIDGKVVVGLNAKKNSDGSVSNPLIIALQGQQVEVVWDQHEIVKVTIWVEMVTSELVLYWLRLDYDRKKLTRSYFYRTKSALPAIGNLRTFLPKDSDLPTEETHNLGFVPFWVFENYNFSDAPEVSGSVCGDVLLLEALAEYLEGELISNVSVVELNNLDDDYAASLKLKRAQKVATRKILDDIIITSASGDAQFGGVNIHRSNAATKTIVDSIVAKKIALKSDLGYNSPMAVDNSATGNSLSSSLERQTFDAKSQAFNFNMTKLIRFLAKMNDFDDDLKFTWALKKNPALTAPEILQTEIIKLQNGFTTQAKAISAIYGISETDAEILKNKIKSDPSMQALAMMQTGTPGAPNTTLGASATGASAPTNNPSIGNAQNINSPAGNPLSKGGKKDG